LWLGKNGALELLVQSFATFENDTEMLQFGLLGCLFDKVAENRIKFGQQGGVSYLLSMLKQDKFYYNNNVNLQVWYAFSAGCYDNAVRFRDAGGIELGVRSMADFPAANRIREEVLQAFKGVSVHSQEMRELVAQAGAGEQYVKAIRENVSDPQLVSLCCENMALLIGGDVQIYSVRNQEKGWGGFNATHQAMLTKAGAMDVLIKALRHEQEMSLRPLATGYNVLPDCIQALAALGYQNDKNQDDLVATGALTEVVKAMKRQDDHRVQHNSCKVVNMLRRRHQSAVEAEQPLECARWR